MGIYVARDVRNKINQDNITVVEASLGGLRLLDILTGYQKAIIIDATKSLNGKVGQIYRLETTSLAKTQHIDSTHDLSLVDALELGRKLGVPVPDKIIIYAIEASDVSTFSEKCTTTVKKSISRCATMVLSELKQPLC